MEMMRIQSTEERTENRSQEKGCYTVEELMDILCVGRKAIYSIFISKELQRVKKSIMNTLE